MKTGCILALFVYIAFAFLAAMMGYHALAIELYGSLGFNETTVIDANENDESDPPEAGSAEFAPSEVSLDLQDSDGPPPETLVLVVLDGEVTAAGIEVGDQGMVSEIGLQPDQSTFYSVGQHRYITTVKGAATVVHLFGPIMDQDGREATTINLSLQAQSVTTLRPNTATLAIESGGALFVGPPVYQLPEVGQFMFWAITPEHLTPVRDGTEFDGSQPFRLGIALTVATEQPGEARYETWFTDTAASVEVTESGPSSGF